MHAYLYPVALALISVLVLALEAAFPWRPEQPLVRRRTYLSDLAHLVFNGHFLGVLLYGVAAVWVLPGVDAMWARLGLTELVHRNAAAVWPLWLQIVVALLVTDFVQWSIHVLLHRVPWLWELHKTHHSIVDGEMSWIAAFRFQWAEVVVYRVLQYVPLAFFGFSVEAVMVHAIFGTLIGHLNHANLKLDWGPLRYVLNSPRMHIWHHDYAGDERTTVNFGIIFSTWDWVFGTARLPEHPPAKLGFVGVETFPRDFLSQQAWPLSGWRPARRVAPALGLALIVLGTWLHTPRESAATRAAGVLFGEQAATTQNANAGALIYPASELEADAALDHFGRAAANAGYAHPEWMVSAPELAAALGATRLVILDVRPPARFAEGHLPTARRVDRTDYTADAPVPGLSLGAPALQSMLREHGVAAGAEIIVMGDGADAYRLWWTLRAVGGLPTRVLDGGIVQWSERGGALVVGAGRAVARGSVTLPQDRPTTTWASLPHEDARFIDARTAEEYRGTQQHPSAARAGRIPGATLWPYDTLFRSDDDPRLRAPAEILASWDELAVPEGTRTVLYCQSGSRSSVSMFALLQAGVPEQRILNYDGSWAEYSRSAEPLERGAGPCLSC